MCVYELSFAYDERSSLYWRSRVYNLVHIIQILEKSFIIGWNKGRIKKSSVTGAWKKKETKNEDKEKEKIGGSDTERFW